MKNQVKFFKWWFIASGILALPLISLAHVSDQTHDEPSEVVQVSPAVLLIGLVGAGGIGVLVWYFMKKGKSAKNPRWSQKLNLCRTELLSWSSSFS